MPLIKSISQLPLVHIQQLFSRLSELLHQCRHAVNRDTVTRKKKKSGIDEATVALTEKHLLGETSKAIPSSSPLTPLLAHAYSCPLSPSQTLSLKGLGSGEQEGIITPLRGNFNTLFCVLIAPPFDPLLMNTLGPYHDQFVIGAQGAGGIGYREHVCVFSVCEGMITPSGKTQTTVFVQ